MDPRWAASLGSPGRQGVVNPAGHRSSHPPQQGWGLLSGGVSILSAARLPCRGLLGAPSLELSWNVWRDTLSSPGDKLCQGVGGNRVFEGRHPQACSSSPCAALVHLQTRNLLGEGLRPPGLCWVLDGTSDGSSLPPEVGITKPPLGLRVHCERGGEWGLTEAGPCGQRETVRNGQRRETQRELCQRPVEKQKRQRWGWPKAARKSLEGRTRVHSVAGGDGATPGRPWPPREHTSAASQLCACSPASAPLLASALTGCVTCGSDSASLGLCFLIRENGGNRAHPGAPMKAL